jgi:hypothetical protein
VSDHWWAKGGAKVRGDTTLDRWAQFIAKAMQKKHPDDPRQGRADIYRQVEGQTDGKWWDAFIKHTSRVVWFKWRDK